MPVSSLVQFTGGLVTKPAPHLLTPDQATVCENCTIDDGSIVPMKASALSATTGTTNASIFKFNGAWKSHTAERWYTQSDLSGSLRLYWADGGIPQKMNTTGTQVRLGIVAPSSGSVAPTYALTVLQEEPFGLSEWDYYVTFFSDPLLSGGWGGESAPYSLGSVDTSLGTVAPAFLATSGVVDVKAGTYNYPPGGQGGYLDTHRSGGFVLIGTTQVRFTACTYTGPIGSATAYWQSATNYTASGVGFGVVPTLSYAPATSRGYWYELTTINGAGISGGTEPTWPTTLGATVTDGDLVWTCRGDATYSWSLSGCKDIRGTAIPAYGAAGSPAQGTTVDAIVKSVTLTVPTSGDSQVNARRIYRSSGGEIKLVAQIDDNATATYTDSVTESDLGDVLTADDNDPPPNLTGICGPHNGMLIGWTERSVYGSKVGDPDSWSELFSFNFDIAACALFGAYVVVLCEDAPYVISGSDPAAMSRNKALSAQGCLYGRTAVDAGGGLLYLSPDGVCQFNGATSPVVSEATLGKDFFASLTNPKAAFHDGCYYLFHDDGVLIGDFRGGAPIWRTGTETCTAVHRSDTDDALYLGKSGQVNEWGAGTDLTWTYTTGEMALGSLADTKQLWFLTVHSEGDVTARIDVDGKRLYDSQETLYGSDRKARRKRLSGACRGYRPSITLTGTGTVYAVEIEHSEAQRAR